MSEGIWGHSSALGGEGYIIATPDNGPRGVREVQDWFAENVGLVDGAVGYKLLYGYWRGEREQPVIFNKKYWEKIKHFFQRQHSYIVLGAADARDNRPAYLVRQNAAVFDGGSVDSHTFIGKFTEVTAETAKSQESYTFDPTTGRYYLAILP